MSTRACPVCQHAFSDAWIRLDPAGPTAAGPFRAPTWVCPNCTVIVPPASATSIDERPRPWSFRDEDDGGHLVEPGPAARTPAYRARLQTLRPHLVGRSGDVLDLECGDGLLLRTLLSLHPARVTGLETRSALRARAQARGLATVATDLASWTHPTRFDVILAGDALPHVHDPLAYLRAVANHLEPQGRALIVVPNVLGGGVDLDQDVFTGAQGLAFTPRALVTACLRAGLMPLEVHAEREIRVVCRPTDPSNHTMQGGPDAQAIAHQLWSDDLRRRIKQAFAAQGPTPEVLRVAARLYRRAPTAHARADLAIEIATGCERAHDYARAEQWLKRSLAARPDAEVLATLRMIQEVQVALQKRVRQVAASVAVPTPRIGEPRLFC